MGATNSIKETNISLQLEGKECPQCEQKFTEAEIDDRNYDIWFDTTNDVKLTPMSEVKNDNLYFPCGITGYQLTIWIRSIEHKEGNCPNTRLCKGCYQRYLEEKMIETNHQEWGLTFYCSPCWKERNKEKVHE